LTAHRQIPNAKCRAKVAAERMGRIAEHIAAFSLMARGYRILDRRRRTAAGEIDLVAVRGRRLAFIEVKQRAAFEAAACAITARQAARLHRAANLWVSARPYYRDHDRGFDSVLLVSWARLRYRRDALQPS
jgi:putative endonuclease